MSTNAASVAEQAQLPIEGGNNLGPIESSALRGLALVHSDMERLHTVPDSDVGASRQKAQKAATAAFAGAFLGCLATLHLSAFGVVPEIASALVTTLIAGQPLILRSTILPTREFIPAVYGGAFGGMTSVLWLSGAGPDHSVVSVVASFISLSIVCGLAFGAVAIFDAYARRRLTHGYGGRSGAIATVACVCFVQMAALCGVDDRLFHAASANLADLNLGSLAPLVAACLTGTVVTMLVLRRERVAAADLADKTFAASAVALIGLLLVHRVSPTDARLLEAYYAGCFLGMSSRERLDGWIETVLGAIVLASLIIQVRMFLPGIGGGLGLAAFVTVAVLVTVKQLMRFVLPINEGKDMTIPSRTANSLSGYRGPTPALEKQRTSWGSISSQPAAFIVGLAAAAALIGGLTWAAQFASRKTIAATTAPVSASDEATPGFATSQTDMRTSVVDAPPAPSEAVAGEPSAGSTPAGENVASQTTSSDAPTDIGAASTAGLRLDNAAADAPAATSEGSRTGQPVTAAPLASGDIAAREPAAASPKDEDSAAAEALFREYQQWRAARIAAAAAKGQHHPRPLANVPAPATNRQPRSEHRLSAAQAATPTTSPTAHAHRPHPENAQPPHAASEQAPPASGPSSASF